MRVDPHSSLLWWVAVGKVQPLLIGLNVPDQAEPSWATPRLYLLLKGRCTPSVGIAPVLIGCSASLRVQRFVTGAAPPIGLSPGATRAGELPSVACDNGYGFPKISHVISLSTFQVLNYGRCNSNVCEASRKLTRLNYVRLCEGAPPRTPPAPPAPAPPRTSPRPRPGLVPAPRAKARARRRSFP